MKKKNIFVASYIGKSENMSDKIYLKKVFDGFITKYKSYIRNIYTGLETIFKGAKYINRPNFSKTKLTVINDRK